MKKGVSYGQMIRNVLVFFLVFLMVIGLYGLYEDITQNDSETLIAETIETTSPTTEETSIDSKETESSLAPEETTTAPLPEETTLETQMSQETTPESQETSEPTTGEETTSETEEIETQPQEPLIADEPVGTICLTFDDGPSSEITNQILDILQEKNVKATFFIINYNEEKLTIVNREIAEGHTVALHGYSHEYSSIYSDLDALTNNFVALRDKLYEDTGYSTNIIRFPGGSSNTVSKKYCTSIMTQATQTLTDMGFVYFDWNVDSRDAGGVKNSEELYNNVVSTLVEGRTNVVLMHDASNKKYTLEALPRIIDYGIQHGFEFQAITEDTMLVQHNVNN